MAFQHTLLIVFAETITALNEKCSREYDSKSSKLSGKNLVYSVSLPTDVKRLGGILLQLMASLQQLMLRGHFIDHNFLKVFVQHLVKQETSYASKVNFGYRFLKYQSFAFRGDRALVMENIF
jgi:hypothetical protein